MTEQVKDDTGCYDIRGRDVSQKYAKYATRNLGDDFQSIRNFARKLLPENHVGEKVWLTNVSGCSVYKNYIVDWSKEFAHAVSTLKPLRKTRRYPLVPSYDSAWGDWAAYDGFHHATGFVLATGKNDRVSVLARCEQLGCKWDSYKKVRNFVASALLTQMAEFEWAMAISIAKHKAE